MDSSGHSGTLSGKSWQAFGQAPNGTDSQAPAEKYRQISWCWSSANRWVLFRRRTITTQTTRIDLTGIGGKTFSITEPRWRPIPIPSLLVH